MLDAVAHADGGGELTVERTLDCADGHEAELRVTLHMRVGANLLYLVPGSTGGMETYARALLPAIKACCPDVEVVAFVNREAYASDLVAAIGADDVIQIPVSGRRRLDWVRGEQLLLPQAARKAGLDVLHNLAWSGPLRPPCPMVTTTHDVAYAHHLGPRWRPRTVGMRVLLPRVARASDLVITVSHFSARDIQRLTGVEAERIRVIYEAGGVGPRVRRPSAEKMRQSLRLGDRPALICPAAKRPHKNLERLLVALSQVSASRRPVIVIPGYSTSYEKYLQRRAVELGVNRDIRMLSWVSTQDLEDIYAVSAAMVFPSLFEGFGLPVLEAFKRSLPVACSNATSLPEIAGGAALLFDPYSPPEIATAIERVTWDEELRQRLAGAGLMRSAMFSWHSTARETTAVYTEVAT